MSRVLPELSSRYLTSRRVRNRTGRRTARLREGGTGLYILTTLTVSDAAGCNASGVPHVGSRRPQLQSHRRVLQTKRAGSGPSAPGYGRYALFRRRPIISHKPTENAPLNTYYIRHERNQAEDTRT